MKLATKAYLAQVTLSLISFVVSLFLLGLLVVVLCAGLHINPFQEATTSFLWAVFGGLIGSAIVLVLLNVASNISLIADAKVAELRIAPSRSGSRAWAAAFLIAAVALVCLVFVGTYLSKERYLTVVRTQADEVLKENNVLLQEISASLASGQPKDCLRIIEIISFLKHQRKGLPELTVIYSGQFGDKQAYYELKDFYYGRINLEKNSYLPSYFACTQNLDCDYLSRFFSGGDAGVLQKYTMQDDKFYIFMPFIGKEARFILLFDRSNQYGKVGSLK